jgi:hypothetical protein
VKPPYKRPDGQFIDPHTTQTDLATLYFHHDGKTPAQLVCTDATTQMRMDFIMAGLMTVLVIETRKALVIKEMGNLPAYDSFGHWDSTLIEEGVDYGI